MDKKILNSNHLKLIAILAMTIDHVVFLYILPIAFDSLRNLKTDDL